MLTRDSYQGREDQCSTLRQRAFDAVDGELSSIELSELEAHLHGCDSCRSRFAADAVFLRVVRAAAALEAAPDSLRERVALMHHVRTTENASA